MSIFTDNSSYIKGGLTIAPNNTNSSLYLDSLEEATSGLGISISTSVVKIGNVLSFMNSGIDSTDIELDDSNNFSIINNSGKIDIFSKNGKGVTVSSLSGDVLFTSVTDSLNEVSGGVVALGGMAVGKTLNVGENINGLDGIHTFVNTQNDNVVTVKNTSTSGYSSLCFKDSSDSVKFDIGYGNSTVGLPLDSVSYIQSRNGSELLFRSDSTDSFRVNVNGSIQFYSTVPSTSSSAGSMRLIGGLSISNITDSSSITNGGSITTAGGVSIGKSLYIGDDINISGKIVSLDSSGIPLDMLNSSLQNDFSNSIVLGMSKTLNNSSILRFVRKVSGNYTGLGFWGNEDIISINENGTVGIGTTDPAAKLHLENSAGFADIQLSAPDGAFIDFSEPGVDFNGRIIYSNSTDNFEIFTAGVVRLTLGTTLTTIQTDLLVNGQIKLQAPTGDLSPVIASRLVPAGQGSSNERSELILFHSNDGANGAGEDLITLRAPALRFQTYTDPTVADIDNDLGSNTRMYINPAGNVGIGTTDPGSPLHVAGTIANGPLGNGIHMGISGGTYSGIQLNNSAGSFIDFSESGVDFKGRLIYTNSTNVFDIYTNGLNRMSIGTSIIQNVKSIINGDFSTGEFLRIEKGGVVTWGSTAAYDATRYIRCLGNAEFTKDFNVGPGGVGIGYAPPLYSKAGTDGLYVNGNVGINTINPEKTLDINGSTIIRSDLTIGSYYDTINITSPSNPTAANSRYYTDSSDKLFKSRDSTGIVTVYQPTNTKGDILTHNGTTQIRIPVGINGYVLKADDTQSGGLGWAPDIVGIGGVGGGTVTSIGVSVPSFLSVTNSPVTTSGVIALGYSGTALPILNGGTGSTTATGTGSVVLQTSPSLITPDIGVASGTSSTFTGNVNSSTLSLTGSTSGVISIVPQAVAGTYNFNMPISPGTEDYVLVSGGGGASPMTWETRVTSIGVSVPSFMSVTNSPVTTSGVIALGYSGTALPILNGGTGSTTATGTGSVVLQTSPSLITPDIGVASGTSLTLVESSSPASPPTGESVIYSDSVDSLLKSKDSLGVVTTYQPTNTKGDLVGHNGSTQVRHPVGINAQLLVSDSSSPLGIKWATSTVLANIFSWYLSDEKPVGTNGGTFVKNTWTTRQFNTIKDIAGNPSITLSSNIVTLTPGQYVISARIPGNSIGTNTSRLYNVTDAIVEGFGTNAEASSNSNSMSFLDTTLILTSTKSYSIQHICRDTQNNTGFGVAIGFQVEVYATMTITKLT